jgi:hypothetical protein
MALLLYIPRTLGNQDEARGAAFPGACLAGAQLSLAFETNVMWNFPSVRDLKRACNQGLDGANEICPKWEVLGAVVGSKRHHQQ